MDAANTSSDSNPTIQRYTFEQYQNDTQRTAIYPGSNYGGSDAINYTILGLIGEAGEIANKWKKYYRDTDGDIDATRAISDALRYEIGDVLWYCSQLAVELGFSLEYIAQLNIAKLTDRKQRDALKGSGDDR